MARAELATNLLLFALEGVQLNLNLVPQLVFLFFFTLGPGRDSAIPPAHKRMKNS